MYTKLSLYVKENFLVLTTVCILRQNSQGLTEYSHYVCAHWGFGEHVYVSTGPLPLRFLRKKDDIGKAKG